MEIVLNFQNVLDYPFGKFYNKTFFSTDRFYEIKKKYYLRWFALDECKKLFYFYLSIFQSRFEQRLKSFQVEVNINCSKN